MTKSKGYSQADLDAVMEHHEWTREDFKRAKPAREVLPASFFQELEKRRRARGAQKAPVKKLVSLRLDPDVLEKLRESGPGWQSRANAVLRKAVGLK
jgi:uncharacterized protein (DUF4415 family)